MAVMWYAYDFSKENSEQEKSDLVSYVNRVAKTTDSHCSVLVNNLAMPYSDFSKFKPQQISQETNMRIENHSFITDLLMIKLREQSLRQYRGLVVNVGSSKDNLVEKHTGDFKTAKEESAWQIYKATTTYWSNLATLEQQSQTLEVDYVRDTAENQGFFAENLKYLGIDVTPGSHVD